MEGQRGKMVSKPETFGINRASSSSGAALDQQLCWNSTRGLPETHFSGFMLQPNDSRIPLMSSTSHEQRNVSGWSFGEASSSSGLHWSSNTEWEVENVWPSTVERHNRAVEDHQPGQTNSALSLDSPSINPLFAHECGSSLTLTPPDINSNRDYVVPKSGGNQGFPISVSDEAGRFTSPRSGGYVGEESEVRLGGSLDGRRVPCKRKSFEGHIGQSSFTENLNFHQPMESSHWQVTPPCFSMRSEPATEPLPELVGPRPGLDLAGRTVTQSLPDRESTGIPHGNFRLRSNSFCQNNLRSTYSSSSVVAATGSPRITLSQANRSLEFTQPLALSGSAPQCLRPSFQVPVVAPGGLSNGSIQRDNSSSSSLILPDEGSSSGGPRNMLEQHPVLVPSCISSSARRLMGANSSSFPGSVDSAPLSSSSSAAPQRNHHSSGPQPNYCYARSAFWMERQEDNVIGVPFVARALAAASDGRRRFASEDVMIPDPSMFFGVVDMHDRHRDMRLDVDNMSYEELLALQERIGNVSTGLDEGTILVHMKQRKHSDIADSLVEAEPCCICQEDYNDGEDIGILECGHDFHRDCIKQWLIHKNLCPICKTTGLTT